MRGGSRLGRRSLPVIVAVIAASWSLLGFGQERPPRELKGWGQAVDPDRDCRFDLEGGRLTIAVPGTKHDLSAEAGDMGAPRVLRDIEGDFIVQVKVSGNVSHEGDRTSKEYLAYHGAGLLLWLDERNYVRLERAAVKSDDGATHYANFELRKDGRRADASAAGIPNEDHYLRVERRGGRILGAVSTDGVHWQPLDPIAVDFPGRIKIGVAAINTSTEKFDAGFQELEVYKREVDRGS